MNRIGSAGALGSVALVVFAASFTLARPRLDSALQETLTQVMDDPARTICLHPEECLRADAEQTLLVFFSARDCPATLHDTAVLDRVYRGTSRARLNIIGVADGMTADEARRFALASGITYPVYVGGERLDRQFRNARPAGSNKPLKVLLSSEGRVQETWISRATVHWQHEDARALLARVAE